VDRVCRFIVTQHVSSVTFVSAVLVVSPSLDYYNYYGAYYICIVLYIMVTARYVVCREFGTVSETMLCDQTQRNAMHRALNLVIDYRGIY